MSELHDPVHVDVVIVGAGLSGLLAANGLGAAGLRAVVLDKGRSVGGRLATRRFGDAADCARADHGAQFFTVRSPDFAEVVHEWRRAGIVETWCHGFGPGGDGHPRYCAVSGMNTIAKYLASTVDVQTEVTVRSISSTGESWLVTAADGRTWMCRSVMLTPPVPQSLALLDAGAVVLPDALRASLDSVTYARCLALLLRLDAPSNVPEPGGVQLSVEDDPWFSFVADNFRKGISEVSTMTLHVHDEPSLRLWDDDRSATTATLLAAAQPWIGGASVIDSHIHGWKFARPIVGLPESCASVDIASAGRLVFAGDAFGGAKIEGAARSGLAAIEALLA
jgi:renalase